MQSTYDLVNSYIISEREQLKGDEQNNYFGVVFGEVLKYYQYLSLVMSRYGPASEQYVASTKERMRKNSLKGNGSWVMTPDEIAEYNTHFQQQTVLLFELESFYVFASILLDRISAATQYYFGLGISGSQWKSFHYMNAYFFDYATAKNLESPSQNILERIQWLYENVSKFRGDFVVHKDNSDRQVRSMMGIGFNNERGGAYFNIGQMYPKDGEVPIIAKKPDEIIGYINTFIIQWIEYLQNNSDSRSLTPPD